MNRLFRTIALADTTKADLKRLSDEEAEDNATD